MAPSSTPLAWASARSTSRTEAPTRKAPVISLFQTKRARRSSSRQARTISSRCTDGS